MQCKLRGREEAAEGETAVATGGAGRFDAATIEEELVGGAGTGDGSRGPVIAALASVAEAATWSDEAAPHKE